MLVKILRATQHITVGQYFDFVQHSPPICTVWTVNDVLVDPYPFHAGIDQAVHVPLYLLNFCPKKNQIKSFFYREPLWSYTYLQPFHYFTISWSVWKSPGSRHAVVTLSSAVAMLFSGRHHGFYLPCSRSLEKLCLALFIQTWYSFWIKIMLPSPLWSALTCGRR